jgi:hypothetical protein
MMLCLVLHICVIWRKKLKIEYIFVKKVFTAVTISGMKFS